MREQKKTEPLMTKVAKSVKKAELKRRATKREDQRFLTDLRHGYIETL